MEQELFTVTPANYGAMSEKPTTAAKSTTSTDTSITTTSSAPNVLILPPKQMINNLIQTNISTPKFCNGIAMVFELDMLS